MAPKDSKDIKYSEPAKTPFPSATEDFHAAKVCIASPQTQSPTYTLAYEDIPLLLRDELRPVRLQLELMKPELIQQEHGIKNTVVLFGSARIPDMETARKELEKARREAKNEPLNSILQKQVKIKERLVKKAGYYEEARKLGRIITETSQNSVSCDLIVMTGGGPGIMEAANRGAHEAGGKSIGLNIVIPAEQAPNSYITPDLCFQFHYFAIRKMHFLMRAKALIVFPGGFGTMDELFETLTLIQTKKIKPIPVVLFGKEFWCRAVDFKFFVEEGMISEQDLEIFKYVETAEEAWEIIARANNLGPHAE